jgi:hypothetical protein
MTASGTGLLDNDVALDASLSFDDVIEGGGSVDEAIDAAMHESEDLIDDEDDRADLILALAWLAAERGAVPEWLGSEARRIVREGLALDRWQAADRARRQAVEQLLLDVLDGRVPHPGRQATP